MLCLKAVILIVLLPESPSSSTTNKYVLPYHFLKHNRLLEVIEASEPIIVPVNRVAAYLHDGRLVGTPDIYISFYLCRQFDHRGHG